jgi:hypothetical protein
MIGRGFISGVDLQDLVPQAAISLLSVGVLDALPCWILVRRWPSAA